MGQPSSGGWSGGPPTDPLGSGPSTAKEDLQYVCLPIQGITLSGSHAHTRGHGNPHTHQPDLAQPLRSALSSIYSLSPLCAPRWQPSRRSLSLKLDWSSFHSRPFLSLVGSRGVLPRRRQRPRPRRRRAGRWGNEAHRTPVCCGDNQPKDVLCGSTMLSIIRLAAPASLKLSCRTESPGNPAGV